MEFIAPIFLLSTFFSSTFGMVRAWNRRTFYLFLANIYAYIEATQRSLLFRLSLPGVRITRIIFENLTESRIRGSLETALKTYAFNKWIKKGTCCLFIFSSQSRVFMVLHVVKKQKTTSFYCFRHPWSDVMLFFYRRGWSRTQVSKKVWYWHRLCQWTEDVPLRRILWTFMHQTRKGT